jgi:hypothetical protein
VSTNGKHLPGTFSVVPDEVLYADISHRAFKLWCVLNRYADAAHQCFPSMRRLCADVGCSRMTVYRLELELIEAGLLDIDVRKSKGLPNLFTVQIPSNTSDTASPTLYQERYKASNTSDTSLVSGVIHQRELNSINEIQLTKGELSTGFEIDEEGRAWVRFPK